MLEPHSLQLRSTNVFIAWCWHHMSDLLLHYLLQMLEETGELQFAYVLNNGEPHNMIWWVPACWLPCLLTRR